MWHLHCRRSPRTRGIAPAVVVLAAWVSFAQPAAAQAPGEPAAPTTAPATAEPIFSRDEKRSATVRAVHLTEPLRVDGRLDEALYRDVTPITDFIQTLPLANATPTERTEAWVSYDATQVYVSARVWESAPPDKWVVNEMRRDTSQLRQNDHFGVAFDTFHDRRNAFFFYANPLGARADSYMTDESNNNADWNPVWDARTGRFDGGWTIEMAIPFKSLRYVSGPSQIWGINLRRSIRRKNEWLHLNPLPIVIGGSNGMMRVSADAALVGLDLPTASRNIWLKPYGIARSTTDTTTTQASANGFNREFGVDAKYGITANLTADFTYNTDFAQAEVDEQQVNLTRFSLQFPEKREFFLEGRGIFEFGRSGSGGNGSNTPQLFYTRRIGLEQGTRGAVVVPIEFGERLTGKVGPLSVGAVNISTTADAVAGTPDTTFSVLRLKRDILRRSSIGVIATRRSQSVVVPGEANVAYGADAAFSFFQNLSMGGYYARSDTSGRTTDNASYQARVDFAPDRYGVRVEHLKVGANFNPELGFVRRPDSERTFGSVRFSPRPKKRFTGIRQFTYEGSIEYIENGSGQLETRLQTAGFSAERQNSDVFSVEGVADHELLLRPFNVSGVTIPEGRYDFNSGTVSYQLGQQRRMSGTFSLQRGQYYDGTITAFGFSTGRLSILKQWSLEPSVSINDVDRPVRGFRQSVLRLRSDYAFSPRRFISALVQYSSTGELVSSNLRFRWEYKPGSELFFVYTDERNALSPRFSELRNRAIVIKMNRLWQF